MRTLETLILALIVGILGSTNARRSVLDVYGSASFYLKLLDPGTYENLREDCGKNGGPEAYNNLAQSLLRFNNDIRPFVASLNNDVKLGQTNLRVGRILSHDDCKKVPVIQESLGRVTESLRACMKPEMRERILIDSRVVNQLLEYICNNKGYDLANFAYYTGGLECLASHERGLLRCAKRSFDHYLPGAEFVGDGISELKGAEILLHLNSKRCADVAQFRNCSLEVLNKCEDRISGEVFKNIILAIPAPSIPFCIGSFDDTPTRTVAVEEISTTSVDDPTMEDLVDSVSDKCEKNGGKSALVALKESWKLFVGGFHLLAAMTWDAADKSDAAVLQTYCLRGVIFNDLEKYLTDTFKSCLAPEEQKTADIMHNIASTLLRELCDNEEKGIAALVADSGLECLDSKGGDIESCVNQTYLGISGAGVDWMKPWERLQKPLVINAKDCTDLVQLRDCTVKALAECEDKTPAFLVDSLFSTIQNEMSCQN